MSKLGILGATALSLALAVATPALAAGRGAFDCSEGCVAQPLAECGRAARFDARVAQVPPALDRRMCAIEDQPMAGRETLHRLIEGVSWGSDAPLDPLQQREPI